MNLLPFIGNVDNDNDSESVSHTENYVYKVYSMCSDGSYNSKKCGLCCKLQQSALIVLIVAREFILL